MTAAGLRSLFRHHRTTGIAKANPHRPASFATDLTRAGISLPALMQLNRAVPSAVPLMSRRRRPPLDHPLAEVFFAAMNQ
jgi:hypothetical protein